MSGAATQAAESQVPAKTMGDVLAKRGIDESQWSTLKNSLFPGARPESVLMVIDYCRARKLDPMKKPCHIVPMKVKDAKTGDYDWRDVVMPGIYEYRTTAMRTGNYLGHSKPEYGPVVEVFGVSAPEWCAMTMYRRGTNGEKIEFPVCVYFRESCNTKFDKDKKEHLANDRWSKAPIQMLTKVTEAAGLREAFPDEFGGEATAEEMDGQASAESVTQAPIPMPQRKVETTDAPAVDGVVEEVKPTANTLLTIAKAEKKESSKTSGKADADLPAGTKRIFYYLITDSTGRVCSSWSEDLYLLAGKLADEKAAVEMTVEAGTPWPKLTELAKAPEAGK